MLCRPEPKGILVKPDEKNINVVVTKTDAIKAEPKETRNHFTMEKSINHKSFCNLQFADEIEETEENDPKIDEIQPRRHSFRFRNLDKKIPAIEGIEDAADSSVLEESDSNFKHASARITRLRMRRRSSVYRPRVLFNTDLEETSQDMLETECKGALNNINPLKKTVSFCTIEIREHPYMMGVNPCVSKGVPLSSEWQADRRFQLPLDKHESMNNSDKRGLLELKLPHRERTNILLRSGYTMREISAQIILVNKTKAERAETNQTPQHVIIKQEMMESIKRGLSNLLTRRKKKETKYLKHALSFD